MRKTAILVVALILGVTYLFAQSKLTNRTKAIAQSVKTDAKTKKVYALKSIDGVQMVTAFVRFADGIERDLIVNCGGTVRAEYPAMNMVTAEIPVAALEALSKQPAIAFIEAANPVKHQMDQARWYGNSQRMSEGYAPLTRSYLGTGVIVGIVDEDFQVTHPAFWNSDHTRYRIKAFWNQNKTGDGGFGYSNGKFYTDSASILAAKYDVSMMSSGHATHVTGIATGADHTMNYFGIAQNADIVITSTTGSDADLTDGASWIMQYADSVGKPCVVNISMGSNIGPHDGTSSCCRILESLVKPGKLIIGAAGNSGDANMHIGKTFTPEDSVVKTMLSYQYGSWYPYAFVDAWGEEGNDFEVSVVVYDSKGDSLVVSSPFIRASCDTSFTYSVNKSIGGSGWSAESIEFDAEISAGISALNNKPNFFMQTAESSMPSDYYLGFIVRSDSGTVHIWTEDSYSTFVDNGYASRGWTSGNGDLSIGEGVGVANKVVAVGSFCTRSTYGTTVGNLSSFSSRGPSVDGSLKPEITAPGEDIMSSIPDKVKSYYNSESTSVDDVKYYYGNMSGTSMACPFVTGVVATWLEANPNLDYADLMQIFDSTATRDSFTGSNLPNNTWGYGKIDGFRGLLYILGLDAPTGVDNVTEHQLVGIYPNPTQEQLHIGFASTDEQVTISVIDIGGRSIYQKTIMNVTPGQEFVISIADAPEGIYMVRIAGKTHTSTHKLVKQ